jgi:hypothetical protein
MMLLMLLILLTLMLLLMLTTLMMSVWTLCFFSTPASFLFSFSSTGNCPSRTVVRELEY